MEKQRETYIIKHKLHPKIHKHTNVHFNRDESNWLNKGSKRNLQPNKNNKQQITNEILYLERAIQKARSEYQENLR